MLVILFGGLLFLPLISAPFIGVVLTSLWTMPIWFLLPIILLAPQTAWSGEPWFESLVTLPNLYGAEIAEWVEPTLTGDALHLIAGKHLAQHRIGGGIAQGGKHRLDPVGSEVLPFDRKALLQPIGQRRGQGALVILDLREIGGADPQKRCHLALAQLSRDAKSLELFACKQAASRHLSRPPASAGFAK